MSALENIVLSLERWQRKNKKIEAVILSLAWFLFFSLRLLNRSVFVSSTLELLLTIGFYIWLLALISWLVLLLNHYFASYIHRRRAGASSENAMLFDAERPATGSVWRDAAVFLLVVAAGFCLVGYFVHQMSIVAK